MEYIDRIYGSITVNEPVVEELLLRTPLQRLKEVNHYGASFYRFPHLTTNRFEHSVGVYYVLRRLGASLVEQVAGLLHDAPHTAFSHVSDIVFGDASQTFHEKFHEKVIFESEIPKILKRNGISVWSLLDKEAFRLEDRALPDLCADRIDYCFRDCVTDKQLDLRAARTMLDNMRVFEGDIVFVDLALAKQFATTYRAANETLWANPLQSALYYLLASAMKLSLEEGIITFEDLFTTDQDVYLKMKSSQHAQVTKLLNDMEHIEVHEDADDYDYHVRPKIRVVDPLVLVGNEKRRISALDPTVKKDNEEFKVRLQKGYYIKAI
jgi:HD superfamily phosphohydrolase